MAPQMAKSLMKEFRASFRRKKVVDPTPKNIAINEANEEELAKLVEMKENLGDQLPPLYSDAALLSFLRARSLNVKEAEKLLKVDENIKRILQFTDFKPTEDENIKRILQSTDFKPSDIMSQCGFSGVIGCDKEGSLVRVSNCGMADVKGVMHAISTIQQFKLLMWMIAKDMSSLEEENKKFGRKNTQFVYIMNLEHLSLNQVSYKPVFDTGGLALKLLQDHYHDTLKSVYFINAPSFFSSVWKLFKPFIQDSLNGKIKFLDGATWKEELLKQIDADVLPQYLGGNRVDSNGDPNCSEIVPMGGPIPESLYATNFLDVDDPDVVVATVHAGATLNFRFPVRQPGSILRWHIQGKDNDIGVAIYREPFQTGIDTPRTQSKKKREEDMSKYEQLTPVVRCQCHVCPEEGSTILWFTGNVILHFDNTYSWMNAKEVYFKMSVRPPTDSEKNSLNSADHAARGFSKMTLKG